MYPTRIRLNEPVAARRRVPIWLVDATDGLTAETGIAGKPNISILGAAPAGAVNNIVEINAGGMPGLYYIELDHTEVATVGLVFISFKTAATAQWHGTAEIWDPDDTAAPTAEAVWDEAVNVHVTPGTFGAAVDDVGTTAAEAVWDEPKAAHQTNGTFGESVQDTETAVEHLSNQGARR